MQIKLRNVDFKYDQINALENINLDINKGITAIVGENGSGKSTLLNVLNLLNEPFKGDVVIDGNLITKKNRSSFKRAISTVYQFSDMQLFNLSIKEDLLYSVRLWKMDENKAIDEIERYFELFDLDLDLLERSPFNLSGGEKKKICIISSLLLNPNLLILDEPTIGLDLSSRKTIIKALKSIDVENIIVVLHDFDILDEVADNVIFLNEGTIAFEGSKEEFFKKRYEEDKINMLPNKYKILKYLGVELDEVYLYLSDEKFEKLLKDKYELYKHTKY